LALSPVYKKFQADFQKLGVRFKSNDRLYASSFPNGRAPSLYKDEAAAERMMASFSDVDLAGWRQVLDFYRRTSKDFLPLQQTALPSREMFQQLRRIASRPADAVRLGRMLVDTSRRFVDRYFKTDEVKGLIAPWAFHSDFGPDVPGGATFSFIVGLSSFANGISIAEGGAGRISQALAALIAEHGGSVITHAEVSRIHVRGGAAVCAETSSGEVISASRAIIAGVTPRLLFGELIDADHLPSGFRRRISRYRYGIGTFVVHLALSEKLQWKAGDDLSDFNTVHVGALLDNMSKTYEQCLAGLIPESPLLIVSQPTSIDATRAPAGHHIARIHSRAFPGAFSGDAAGRISAKTWDAAKEAVADRLVAQLAEHAPNVNGALLARHAVSPTDLERDNPNFVGGDCASGSQHVDQNYFGRPAFGWSSYRTPIKRLYMIGSSTWPGSGIHGSSGYLLASRLLRDG
jgi:phytoene dehydrogenase-like protein